jgi:hypothetical protein
MRAICRLLSTSNSGSCSSASQLTICKAQPKLRKHTSTNAFEISWPSAVAQGQNFLLYHLQPRAWSAYPTPQHTQGTAPCPNGFVSSYTTWCAELMQGRTARGNWSQVISTRAAQPAAFSARPKEPAWSATLGLLVGLFSTPVQTPKLRATTRRQGMCYILEPSIASSASDTAAAWL